jgi:subtilisin family serine protease
MGSKSARRQKLHNWSIECLESRQMMSADPIGSYLGGPVEHHGFNEWIEEAPTIVHHDERSPDFWIDDSSGRDLDTLLGDIEQTLQSAHGVTGLNQVRNDYGFLGAGQTVAVIDSGIAWNHYALGSGLGDNYRVVGGWDFAENDADPYDDGPAGAHGTHVAGIVGADRNGVNDDGVASGVDLVGLRVFDDAGNGYFNWVESALQWVHQNRNSFVNPITAVNLSLGTSWNSDTPPMWTTIEDEFQQLKADGIFIAVSAGNSFASYGTPGLSYPAASPYVVPVMSIDDSGALSSFSQRHARAIAAPGRNIVSTAPDYAGNNNGVADDFKSMSGTSMAAPYVAGASVLIREAMEFVGYANITQDTIYDHMMATATSFFDAATGQTYKKLNLTSAFNALMPSDEYGSTAGTAHSLGALSGISEITGLIGKLNDADYFSFTAAATGSVSFTATTTHGLVPIWNAPGGTVSGEEGEVITLDVVAGNSYTLGLSTSGGIGYYTIAVDAGSEETPIVDWGTVTHSERTGLSCASESWYRVQASTSGYLSTEALFSTTTGDIHLALYNSDLQLLATSSATSSGARVDLIAEAGNEYFVCVTGTNADIDFRLTNLVSVNAHTLTINGTSSADSFSLVVGAKDFAIDVNGTTYQFTKAAVSTINITGGAGNDAITITGSSKKEMATLAVGTTTFSGKKFSATVTGVESVAIVGGGGKDTASLYDSAGDDLYQSYSDHVVMSGAGYDHSASGFRTTLASSSTGNDTAQMYDSVGNDKYRAYFDKVAMTGKGYSNTAAGFETTIGHSSGGIDKAWLYDSTGDDAIDAYADHVTLTGAGFNNTASGFEKAYGYASIGHDSAELNDSAGDGIYRSTKTCASMTGAGYDVRAYKFEVNAWHSSTQSTSIESIRLASEGLTAQPNPEIAALSNRVDCEVRPRDVYSRATGRGIQAISPALLETSARNHLEWIADSVASDLWQDELELAAIENELATATTVEGHLNALDALFDLLADST